MSPGDEYDLTGHGEWDALAVGWAMSALDPEDEAIFLPHLATCDQCATTVAETTRTVGDIALTVPSEAPPPGLRGRLMSAVYAEPRGALPFPATAQPPTAQPPTAQPPTAQPPTAPPPRAAAPDAAPPPAPPAAPAPGTGRPAGSSNVVPLRPRRARLIAAAAAAVAVIAGLGGWNAKLHSDQGGLRTQVAQRDAVISELTTPGPALVVPMNGADGKRLATVVARTGGTDVISEALPENAGNTTYWLWSLGPNNQAPVPIAGFTVGSGGISLHALGRTAAGPPTSAYALSREAGGGRPTRPTEVVASGQAG
jgi:anti-sigma factor RsiW